MRRVLSGLFSREDRDLLLQGTQDHEQGTQGHKQGTWDHQQFEIAWN